MIATQFVYGFCAGFFAAELLIAWIMSAPLRPKAPKAQPPIEIERWSYTIVDDGAIYVGLEPKLERTVWLSTIEPHAGRVKSAALVAIAHNKPEARN